MTDATLIRDESGLHGTFGVLAAGSLRIQTLEPPWRDNERNRSCIRPGFYEAIPHLSPRFGRCFLVADVPGRSHILIHSGNLGGDEEAGFLTHTRGCLLPGLRRGQLRVQACPRDFQSGGRPQKAVLSSRTALRHLTAWAAGRPFDLEIRHV